MNESNGRQQIIDTIRDADTILVTVGINPTVDQLAAALGLTMLLNEVDKHTTAVVSGDIPPAISFLDPEKTFQNSVDSLRDFVIALDKEKADHLRYKVEGDVVKIFITPYRTIISEKDLKYSQGDYNVEMVIALGVDNQDHLDKALEAHGKILHDAAVATIGLEPSTLGSIDWADNTASSICEMLATMTDALLPDGQKPKERVASSLLTGIVAATERFSNEKTSARTMTVSAQLMAAGANQQLIASKLRDGEKLDFNSDGADIRRKQEEQRKRDQQSKQKSDQPKKKKRENGGLSIKHADLESEKVKSDKPPKQEAPIETHHDITAPKDGQYDPASAFDEALKKSDNRSEQKAQQQQDTLASTLSSQAKPQQPEPRQPQPQQKPKDSQPVSAPEPKSPEDALAADLEKVGVATSPKPQNQGNATQSARTSAPAQQQASASPALAKAQASNIAPVSDSTMETPYEPSMGGTLNATTSQAAEDKRRQADRERNRTILSHGGDSYLSKDSSDATYQAPPFNGAGQTGEPESIDPFKNISTKDAATVAPLPPLPPLPSAPSPEVSQLPSQPPSIAPQKANQTLADLDRENRSQTASDDPAEAARVAAHAAIDGDSDDVSNNLPVSPPPMPPQPPQFEGALPPMPPQPDFSQLPPLPAEQPPAMPQPPTGAVAYEPPLPPEQLEGTLPPPPPPQATQPSDPGQFKIPGQP